MIKSPTLVPAKSRRVGSPARPFRGDGNGARIARSRGTSGGAELARIHARIELYESQLAELTRAADAYRELLRDLQVR